MIGWIREGSASAVPSCVDCLDDDDDCRVEVLIADICDSNVGEQDLRESTGDNDLGVEYGEMVVESYEGKVLSSNDSKGGEGVLTLNLKDAISSLISDWFGESIDVL